MRRNRRTLLINLSNGYVTDKEFEDADLRFISDETSIIKSSPETISFYRSARSGVKEMINRVVFIRNGKQVFIGSGFAEIMEYNEIGLIVISGKSEIPVKILLDKNKAMINPIEIEFPDENYINFSLSYGAVLGIKNSGIFADKGKLITRSNIASSFFDKNIFSLSFSKNGYKGNNRKISSIKINPQFNSRFFRLINSGLTNCDGCPIKCRFTTITGITESTLSLSEKILETENNFNILKTALLFENLGIEIKALENYLCLEKHTDENLKDKIKVLLDNPQKMPCSVKRQKSEKENDLIKQSGACSKALKYFPELE